jgi:nucleolar MIF4G domain-containing protein 1
VDDGLDFVLGYERYRDGATVDAFDDAPEEQRTWSGIGAASGGVSTAARGRPLAEEEEEEEDEEAHEGHEEEVKEDESSDASSGDDDSDDDNESDGAPGGHATLPASAYIPPALRRQMEEAKRSNPDAHVHRAVQGLVNRIAVSNLERLATDMAALVEAHGRNRVADALADVVCRASADEAVANTLSLCTFAALVGLLHQRVGAELSAPCLQKLAVAYSQAFSAAADDKRCRNIITVLAYLYVYGVVECTLVFDLVRQCLQQLLEPHVELILIVVRCCGLQIRSDDPAALRDIIVDVQQGLAKRAGGAALTPRMHFLVDTLTDLRNNRMKQSTESKHVDTIVAAVPSLAPGRKSAAASSRLSVRLHDLLSADTHGRWWLVGSAWAGAAAPSEPVVRDTGLSTLIRNEQPATAATSAASVHAHLAEAARRLRMNTDTRRTIFSVIMTAEDYMDAFEKLLRLRLDTVLEREIARVLVDCCVGEKTYNPFYALVGAQLCRFSNAHKITFQFVVWDRFETLSDLPVTGLKNLILMCGDLLVAHALSLTMLKKVVLAETRGHQRVFFKRLLLHLVQSRSDREVEEMFVRVARSRARDELADSLSLFLKTVVLPDVPRSDEAVRKRVKLAMRIVREVPEEA